jgi:hypothetical protein
MILGAKNNCHKYGLQIPSYCGKLNAHCRSANKMNLLMILLAVFAAVALMVILGERFAKPIDEQQQAKYGKIIPILVFVSLFLLIIKNL